MTILKWVVRPYLYLQYFFQRIMKTGSFGKDPAVYVQTPYATTGNMVKDGLFRYHVKQSHESWCSVASISAVVNILLDRKGTLNGTPVTQQDLLDTVTAAHWKERMSDEGYRGRRGLPLPSLGQVVKSSLKAYGLGYRSIEVVQAKGNSRRIRQILRSRLEDFETRGNCLIISHFDQGSFLPELHIPHISPVGGFDPATDTVTLLDVDTTQAYPYQISFDRFYRGLSYNYNFIFRKFGYAEGGYVFIRL